MTYFRKRLVVIEAVRVNATDFNGYDWDGNPFNEIAPDWLIAAITTGVIVPDVPHCTDYAEFKIKTLEGEMLASPGDWIIRGTAGEIYPCKPDIFAAIYEPASAMSAGTAATPKSGAGLQPASAVPKADAQGDAQ